jgi:hypothetical protein
MATTRLTRTASGGSNQIYTASCWIKRTKLGTTTSILTTGDGSADNNARMLIFDATDKIEIAYYNAGFTYQVTTNRLFRDTSAWYHLVVAVDTTQVTASDRIKIYVNGVQETSFATSSYPSLNATFNYNSSAQYIGDLRGSGIYGEFLLSHLHYIDGTAYDADTFGSTDATTGIWKPKTAPSVTYGTNGFFLKGENSGSLGTDSSGNGNNFTVNGTPTQTIDTPSNVFATMSPLMNYASDPTYSNGNLKLVAAGGAWHGSSATLAFGKGKWYWEVKLTGTMTNHFIGVQTINLDVTSAGAPMNLSGTTSFYNNDGGEMSVDGTATTNDYGILSSGDIMGLAVDMDAGSYGQITIYKNGVAIVSNFNLSSNTSDAVYPYIGGLSSTQEINFGNGFFGTTAVASGNADDNGIGVFEYAPPTGYLALCTKNINAQEYS